MDKATFEKRKKVIYDLICDDLYVPMKIKEIAIILQIPREQRDELKEILDALIMEGKIEILVISGRLSFIQNVINYFGIKTIWIM